jgi:hypothetical protein
VERVYVRVRAAPAPDNAVSAPPSTKSCGAVCAVAGSVQEIWSGKATLTSLPSCGVSRCDGGREECDGGRMECDGGRRAGHARCACAGLLLLGRCAVHTAQRCGGRCGAMMA